MKEELKKNTTVVENETYGFGELLLGTGMTVASLVLVPALSQRFGVSPAVVNALKFAIKRAVK